MSKEEKQQQALKTMMGLMILVVVIITIVMVPIKLYDHHADKEIKNNDRISLVASREWQKAQKKPYITIDTYKDIFSKVNDVGDMKLAQKMDQTEVVNDKDGHVYLARIKYSARYRDLRAWQMKLTPLQNGKHAMIDKNWQKSHKDND